MAKCSICGKKAVSGMSVARTGTRGFIKKRSKRRFKPNIRTVRIKTGEGTKKIKVCAKCLKNLKLKTPTFAEASAGRQNSKLQLKSQN